MKMYFGPLNNALLPSEGLNPLALAFYQILAHPTVQCSEHICNHCFRRSCFTLTFLYLEDNKFVYSGVMTRGVVLL